MMRVHQFAQADSLVVNLEDLRARLTKRLAMLVIGAAGLSAWLLLPYEPFSWVTFGLLLLLLPFGAMVLRLADSHPALARRLLVWGLAGGLLAAMGLSADPWLPFLGLLIIFAGAMLISGGEIFLAGLIAAVAAWGSYSGLRVYPLLDLILALSLGVALAWLVVNTLYTALQWAWSMQQRADHLLDQVRDRQADLSRALKSSELANALLRRTQRELIVARKQADEARRMKEQFAANISHELRTPLNLILGFSEVMYRSPEVYGDMTWPPMLRRDVSQVYRSSRHLLGMIDDILDLSRFEMAGFTLNKEPTDLAPLLRHTLDITENLFRSRDNRLEAQIEPDLPTPEIDRTRIRQVLLNLLNNAYRLTEEGTVRLEARRADGEVVISVSDTGPGIPADKLPHIFEEFFQVDLSLRRSHQGAGLGLAISRRFVQAHKGRIWAESEPGQGATFFFTLPVPGQAKGRMALAAKTAPEIQWPEPRPRLLVVDSDPAVAALIRRYAETYEVIQIEEAAQLPEGIEMHHPQAVIHNVPPVEPCYSEQFGFSGVPVIRCSLPSQSWLAGDLAVAACLTKPVEARQLLVEIDRLDKAQQVLIVDDDRGFGQLVKRILEATGRPFQTCQAYEGEEGLQAMRRRRPDLVLLDLIMPGMDGFEVIERMRQDPDLADIPVVLLTASSYGEDILRRFSSQVLVHRSDGLQPAQVLSCLLALANVLEPRYDERSLPAGDLLAGGPRPPAAGAAPPVLHPG